MQHSSDEANSNKRTIQNWRSACILCLDGKLSLLELTIRLTGCVHAKRVQGYINLHVNCAFAQMPAFHLILTRYYVPSWIVAVTVGIVLLWKWVCRQVKWPLSPTEFLTMLTS